MLGDARGRLNVGPLQFGRRQPRLTELSAEFAGSRLIGLELLADDGEVGFVCSQSQHNQVGCGEQDSAIKQRGSTSDNHWLNSQF